MSYAFMDIEKIKTIGTMTSKYNHNCRKVEVSNADASKSELNEDLIPLPVVDGKELSYAEAFQRRIEQNSYYQDHSFRRDAVKGYEVLLTYSRDDSVNVEQWKRQSIQWLKDTFNVAGDGHDNVLHATFHADETGNVHIHAFVVPIDERGKLCARSFTNGSRALGRLQTSYAKSVENLGIRRGIEGSGARHQDIRKMYANLNNAINIPDILPDESARAYRQRVLEDFQTLQASSMRAIDNYATETRRNLDRERNEQNDELEMELTRFHKTIREDLQDLQQKKSTLEKECSFAENALEEYRQMMETLAQQMFEIKSEIQDEEEREAAVKYKMKIERGIELISENSPKAAKSITAGIQFAIETAENDECLQKQHIVEEEIL